MIELAGHFHWKMPMISLQQCTCFAGLSSHEVILGVTPSARHEALFRSYIAITSLSKAALRSLIVTDLRDFLDLGAIRQAGDRLIVLRRFLSDYPDARLCASSGPQPE
jgi:hypothetical protein